MSYRTTRILASVLLAAGLYGCAPNPADNVPAATVNTPKPIGSPQAQGTTAPGTATPAPAATSTATPQVSPSAGTSPSATGDQILPLAEGTEVKFTGSKVTGSHNGGFRSVTGSVSLPKDDDISKAKIDITIDMKSTYADDQKLTTHLLSPDFFDVEAYPTSTFKSTAIAKTDGGYLVTGDLTLHGVTQSINIPAEITINAGQLSAKSEFQLNRKLFKIEYPGKPDDLIRDEVVILFDIKAGTPKG